MRAAIVAIKILYRQRRSAFLKDVKVQPPLRDGK